MSQELDAFLCPVCDLPSVCMRARRTCSATAAAAKMVNLLSSMVASRLCCREQQEGQQSEVGQVVACVAADVAAVLQQRSACMGHSSAAPLRHLIGRPAMLWCAIMQKMVRGLVQAGCLDSTAAERPRLSYWQIACWQKNMAVSILQIVYSIKSPCS